jgi:hypothetical protein
MVLAIILKKRINLREALVELISILHALGSDAKQVILRNRICLSGINQAVRQKLLVHNL